MSVISVDYSKMAPFLQNKAEMLESSMPNTNHNTPGAAMSSKDYTLQQLQNTQNYAFNSSHLHAVYKAQHKNQINIVEKIH